MRWPTSLALLTLACTTVLSANAAPAADAKRKIDVQRAPNGAPYGLIGRTGDQPQPTLIVIAHGLDVMRDQPGYTEVAAMMAAHGWASVVIEPPCHGEDAREGEPGQLAGWRHRLERGENFLPEFAKKCSTILDHLIQQGIADPERIAVAGTSRGGYLAYHVAAEDSRVKAAAGLSPVTRLSALREFANFRDAKLVDQCDAALLADKLAGRAIWLSIGNNDARVNTDNAIAFTRAVVQASIRPEQANQIIPVDLLVGPSPGHGKIARTHEMLAAWLLERFPVPTKQGER